ncbi:MAG: NAD-dependent epimerase/dehydratase family protein [Labilithrix sp.]|nr:NAD-dependent epimerase/dehydratase family protein [Labilithrix sp.]MCW5833488.1 NAD-dependent epimerase/dehydratase family protein [Labilithrix sp.]
MSRRALVLGATGLVGGRAVAHLVDSPAYERVTCLVRRATLATSDVLRERVVDFAKLTADDVEPADDLYCAIGSTMKKAGSREAFRRVDLELPLRVAELAVAAGVKRIALVSSVGASAEAKSFYLRTKGELEDALAALPLTALHVMRPSLLLGDREESRPGEAIATVLARAANGLLVGGLRRWRAIDVDDVGRAMVAATTGPDPDPPRRIHEHDAIVALSRALPPPRAV